MKTWIAAGVAMLAAVSSGTAEAVEVYQWTDENGVIHFSQWAPGDQVEDVATVNVEGGGEQDNGLGISEEDDPEGYRAHREEMNALWSEIEERREALRARRDTAPATEIIYVGGGPDYAVPYFPPHFRPFPRPRPHPGPKPRPEPDEPGETGPPPSVPFKRP